MLQAFDEIIRRVITRSCGITCSNTSTLTQRTLTSSTEMHPIYRQSVTSLRNWSPMPAAFSCSLEVCDLLFHFDDHSHSVLWCCWLGGRKGIWGYGRGGHWLVRMEWCPAGWSVCLPLLIFHCTIKSRSSLLALAHPDGPRKMAVKCLWCGVVVSRWTYDARFPHCFFRCSGRECSEISRMFFTGWMTSCHPTNSVKALKRTYSTNSSQRNSSTGLIYFDPLMERRGIAPFVPALTSESDCFLLSTARQ